MDLQWRRTAGGETGECRTGTHKNTFSSLYTAQFIQENRNDRIGLQSLSQSVNRTPELSKIFDSKAFAAMPFLQSSATAGESWKLF